MEPSIAIHTPPGLRNKPGWSTFLIAFVTKWYSFLIAILGQVAWFFNSAGGLVFFEHWHSFFLTFAIKILSAVINDWEQIEVIVPGGCYLDVNIIRKIDRKIKISA